MIEFMRESGRSHDGYALPIALIGIFLLAVSALVIFSFARTEVGALGSSLRFESAIHAAETAAELAVANLADPDQGSPPFEAPESPPPPGDEAGDRRWAIDHAESQLLSDCSNAVPSAAGDGFAVVDPVRREVYGVGFVPNCAAPATVRVVRMAFTFDPIQELSISGQLVTGGNLHLVNNPGMRVSAQVNGDLIGCFSNAQFGTVGIAGTHGCSDDDYVAAPPVAIPNLTARAFWRERFNPSVNTTGRPFYEMCPPSGGDAAGIYEASEGDTEPCESAGGESLPGWEYFDSYVEGRRLDLSLGGSNRFASSAWGPSWVWTSNSPPPEGIYYAFESNLVIGSNNPGDASTYIAEADRSQLLLGNGSHSGNVLFTRNPHLRAAWTNVAVVADVDVMVAGNPKSVGLNTLVFAREQFASNLNADWDDLIVIACDHSLADSGFDADQPFCGHGMSPVGDSTGSPVHVNFLGGGTFDGAFDDSSAPIIPNIGIAGVSEWEPLFGD